MTLDMQILKLSAAETAKLKAADHDPVMAVFKKSILKKARDMSRRHRGELVRIVGADDEILEAVQEPKQR